MLAVTVILRLKDCTASLLFSASLRKVRDTLLDAYAYGGGDLDDIVRDLDLTDDAALNEQADTPFLLGFPEVSQIVTDDPRLEA